MWIHFAFSGWTLEHQKIIIIVACYVNECFILTDIWRMAAACSYSSIHMCTGSSICYLLLLKTTSLGQGREKILLTLGIYPVALMHILNSMQAPHSFSSVCSDHTANRHWEITHSLKGWELHVCCTVTAGKELATSCRRNAHLEPLPSQSVYNVV